jgi:hypothetical protein
MDFFSTNTTLQMHENIFSIEKTRKVAPMLLSLAPETDYRISSHFAYFPGDFCLLDPFFPTVM